MVSDDEVSDDDIIASLSKDDGKDKDSTNDTEIIETENMTYEQTIKYYDKKLEEDFDSDG